MIAFNLFANIGAQPYARYRATSLQLLNVSDKLHVTAASLMLNGPAYDVALTANIQFLEPGLVVPLNSRERAAMFSLQYTGQFTTDSINHAQQVAGLQAMLGAMADGDRAEAWYELRYGLNEAGTSKVARAHFGEAQIFGLYQSAAPHSASDLSEQDALLAVRMSLRHASTIAAYETSYASALSGARKDVKAIALATGETYSNVVTIDKAVGIAERVLVRDFADLHHIAPALYSALSQGSPLHATSYDAVLIAGDVADDAGGDAHTVTGGALNDLIFGSIGIDGSGSSANDMLSGGGGDDFIVGGGGADTIAGGDGNDTVSYLKSTAAVTVDLGTGQGSRGDAQGDTYLGIENVLGTTKADVLTGDFAVNLLYGHGGNDIIAGGLGGDTLIGGKGNDTIWGDAVDQADPVSEFNSSLTQVGRDDLSHGNTLVGGMGGAAGYGENDLGRNDDGSSASIDITSVFGANGLNFFGTNYTSLFVNNNGNITFTAPNSDYTPGQIDAGTNNPIIAAFWADVDTRGTTGVKDLTYYDLDATNGVFSVTWLEVGSFSQQTFPVNSFQLQLISEGDGNFDIVLRYQEINWTAGAFSGTSYARAGYSAGNGENYFELSESGNDAAMKDLPNTEGNTGVDGLFVFHVINGQIIDANDTIDGGAGTDTLIGGPGGDTFVFHAGEANGDTVRDFADASGDRLVFQGYASGTTFTQIDSTHWQVGSDVITFENAPSILASDYTFI